ncbi:MAG: hypothetical protein LC128_14125 [Chitinophagales bacterium]|nr:hypothetical protein [Chitinophagales bacterium]
MQIVKATRQSRNEIIGLLSLNNLPIEDLPVTLADFYTASVEGKVTGLIDMKRYSHYGLLRSMIVHPDGRTTQTAEKLVHLLEQEADNTGITTMYLLMETAEIYYS